MKSHIAMTGAIAAILLAGSARAQTSSGFSQLPPVPQTGQLQNKADADHFWFIVAGDNRPATKKSPWVQPPTPSQIFTGAQQFSPVFFLWCGDIIAGHKVDRKLLKKEYAEFFRIAQQAKVPVFNAPGNHEMDTVATQANETVETPNAQLQAIYLDLMNFPAQAPPYGAFNYGNSRFIALDTEEVAPPDAMRSLGPTVGSGTKKLKLDPGFVSPQQLALLTQDLDANKDKAHIFVFMHHPIIPLKTASGLNKQNADDLLKLFRGHQNVSYVIAAHEHLYYNASIAASVPAGQVAPTELGPIYLVSGGAGAPLDKCDSSAGARCGSFNHYLAFEVDRDTVKVQVIKVPSVTGKSRNK